MTALFHPQFANVLGIIVLAIWLHLVFGRGWFWRVGRLDADRARGEWSGSVWPRVVAVVPARNEEETIRRAVGGLVLQDYPGEFRVVVVDDHSEDATAKIVRSAAEENEAGARVSIASASDLPSGWTGKLWALNEGISRGATSRSGVLSDVEAVSARGGAVDGAESRGAEVPAYYWFTDADVAHAPDTLRRLVGRAEQEKLDLASLMVLLQAETLPERALIPAFVYFFLMLYPPGWIADEDLGTAGAAGGCILLKREALARIGGLAAIRGEVIDDCALARAVKASGGRVRLWLTRKSVSLRAYRTFGEIRDLIARTAFTQLRYSAAILAGTLVGMILTYVAPVVLVFARDSTARVLGLAAWILMAASFWPTARFYRLSAVWAPLLPLTAAFYTYATWVSAVRYWTGKGGSWKGRAQAPKR